MLKKNKREDAQAWSQCAVGKVQGWARLGLSEGNVITFFTARENKDREVTENWLKEKGFKYHGLIMDKPRIKDGQDYVWIDNRKIRGITYEGKWTELTQTTQEILTFKK